MLEDKTLHITNGDSLTHRLLQLNISNDIITWREILCEGPAPKAVFSESFIEHRIQYLKTKYNEKVDYSDFVNQFTKIDIEEYGRIVLWFEYDLFCHINMAAAVAFIRQNEWGLPVFLVCSGKIDDSGDLFGLPELSDELLLKHYTERKQLETPELDTLSEFWRLYTSNDHRSMTELNFSEVTLPYLNHCVQAHFKRFPKASNGLNKLEELVLFYIDTKEFNDERQLLRHLLKNQGYFGFGDSQWNLVIKRMNPYFKTDPYLKLTPEGNDVLAGKRSAWEGLKDQTQFGGSLKYEYFYDLNSNQLKPVS